MSEFVRVRFPNGIEKSMPLMAAVNAGMTPLDKPAYGQDGRLRPPKPHVPLGARRNQPTTPTKKARPASDRPKEG